MPDFGVDLFTTRHTPLPSLMDIQQQKLTLGQLSQQVEQGGLNLEILKNQLAMQRDPRYPELLAGYARMASGTAPDGSFENSVRDLFTRYPMQGNSAIQQMMTLAQNASGIREKQASADKSTMDARVKALETLSNAADGLARSEGPLMPDKVIAFLRQASYLNASPLLGDVVQAVQGGDEAQVRSALLNFSQAGTSMVQRATARKDTASAEAIPQELDLKRFQAALQAGEVAIEKDANGNMVLVKKHVGAPPVPGMPQPAAPAVPQAVAGTFPQGTPAEQAGSLAEARAADAAGRPVSFAPGAQATSVSPAPVAPASGPSGASPNVIPTGVQVALDPVQTAQSATRTKTLDDSRQKAMIAQRVLQIAPQLRAELAQGYTGPLAASEAGRTILNLAASTGALSPEQLKRVGAMRASDALVTELLGPLAHTLSARGSNFITQLAQRAKPGAENATPIAMQMLSALQTDARNQVTYDKTLNEYVTTNPKDFGLSGWKAPDPELPPPPGKFADKLPPANLSNLGWKAHGDDGRVYESNGREWVLKK